MPHNDFRLIQSDPLWATSASGTPSIMWGWVTRIFASIRVLGASLRVRSGPGGEWADWILSEKNKFMDPNQHLGLQCEPSLLVLDEGDKDGFSFYLDNLIQEYIYIYI